MRFFRRLALALFAGIAAGVSAALQTEELRSFSVVPSIVAYGLIALVGLGVGALVKGVQEGLIMALSITVVSVITIFLALYLPNVEIVATAPELILRSIWWGGLWTFFLTLMGMVVGRILSGE